MRRPHLRSVGDVGALGRPQGAGRTPRRRATRFCGAYGEDVAVIMGVRADEIPAILTSAAEAMSQVALSLPLRGGDNVVVQDAEFRSASLPWAGLRRRGVEVRLVAHAAWTPEETAFAAAVDGRTRAIVTSQVNYLTGIQHNLEALRAIADRAGAALVVDATHAAGRRARPWPPL
ncbi:MAG: aminotransferase class V-fold PLP-dependent enzyme [Dehalococcoidia bacterium]